jgi:hypothetical protein
VSTLQPTVPRSSEDVPALTPDEAAIVFERAVRRYLKMSTTEFLSRLESGYFRERPELERRLDSVLFYLPLIKR